MKKMIIAVVIVGLFTAMPVIAEEAHHAEKEAPAMAGQAGGMEQQQSMMDPAMMQQFNERMDKMQQIGKQIMGTKKGKERQKLMREHMDLMQANMKMMGGQGMMGGKGMMQGGKGMMGSKSMMHGGQGMMGEGGMMKGPQPGKEGGQQGMMMGGEGMMMCQPMMERMQMMQQMMERMMEQQKMMME